MTPHPLPPTGVTIAATSVQGRASGTAPPVLAATPSRTESAWSAPSVKMVSSVTSLPFDTPLRPTTVPLALHSFITLLQQTTALRIFTHRHRATATERIDLVVVKVKAAVYLLGSATSRWSQLSTNHALCCPPTLHCVVH